VTFDDLHPRRFFLETWQNIDRHAESERVQRSSYDYRPLLVYAWGAVCLTLMEYIGNTGGFEAFLQLAAIPIEPSWRYYELAIYVWWTGWRVTGYFLLPVAFVWLVLRERIRAYGLQIQGMREHLWMYILFFVAVFGCILVISRHEAFVAYYPFYTQADQSWAELLAWEIMYIGQFFALEFFFRGFLLVPCKAAMGSSAIFAMTVPYTLIHFDKPMLEVFAAIVAGVVLGTLAMRTRSILSGFMIHSAVAVSMDLVSLLRRSSLPSTLWPKI
jgi:membrane protease YdiL (CAAX protease family)